MTHQLSLPGWSSVDATVPSALCALAAPKLTYGQIKSFMLYAIRTVLSGEEKSSSSWLS